MNVCAQTEFGLKPFQQPVSELQLGFYTRRLGMGLDRWVGKAFREHSSGMWSSPYLSGLTRMRCQVDALGYFHNKTAIHLQLNSVFLIRTNESIRKATLPALERLKYLERQPYLCEGVASSTLA